MSAGFDVKGWCPGALRPMESGDGWVVRIRAQGGRLTGAQLARVADLARAHGNGLVDLSARASLQLRGVCPETHAPLVDELGALGLIDDDVAAEARRNVLLTPFWTGGDGTPEMAARLEATLADAPALPGKFGFAIDTGRVPVLRGASADIRLERGADGRLVVGADGAGFGCPVDAGTAARAMIDLAQWFVASGGVRDGRGRMAGHLARGAVLPPRFSQVPMAAAAQFAAVPGRVAQGVLVGLRFGQTDATTLAALAPLVGAVRLTPWRMLLLEGLTEAPDLPGLIARAGDPLLRVVACTGAPGCPQGRAPTRPLAAALAGFVPEGRLLHVSGCAKGCAHPGPADLTLTATAEGFDLIAGGRAADVPTRRGLSFEALTQDPTLLTGTTDAARV